MPASRIRPWLILALVWACWFLPLILHPTQTLYSDYSDLLAEHRPARVFLVREWRTTGELPLWNPYHFCGAPFVHDIQVGTFYPPYAATFLFHEQHAGAVMSWAIAMHVLAASLFAYLYARSRGLGEAGSLVAGIGFAYSAKWITHLLLAGHTVTIGLAWLPLVLLGLESFQRTRRLIGVLGGGVAFALLVLGTHPQWTFYSGLFIAAWTLPNERTKVNLLRWMLGGVGVVLIAALLAAVQLLPTWEASQYSTRTEGLAASHSLLAGMFSLLSMVGPSAAYDPPSSWELRSLLSLFGLAAAIVAPKLASEYRWQRSVLLLLLAFSFGGAVLVEWLPGFNLFRAASRMLVIAAFPVAFLAGATLEALIDRNWSEAARVAVRRALLLTFAVAAVPSLGLTFLMRQGNAPPLGSSFILYWSTVAVGLAATMFACSSTKLSTRMRTGLWALAFCIELMSPAIFLVNVKPQADIDPESELVNFLNANANPAEARVIDIERGARSADRFAPLGIGSPQALTHRIAMPRGYNPLDVRHYREFVNFTMGSDRKVLSLEAVAQPIIPNFPRNEPAIWNHLNVRYLVCFEDYFTNPAFRDDPGHRLVARNWRIAARFETTPAVPALPPERPDPLPPIVIVENLAFQPRAFVVPESAPMPPGRELQALTSTDLRKTVLLSTDEPPTNRGGIYRPAAIREYGANRVAIDLAGGEAGWLVLSDVWFPGWTCRVDGVDVPVHRANHTFRAVAVPAGAKEVVFRFEPRSYRIGWWISVASLAAVIASGGLRLISSRPTDTAGGGCGGR